MHFVDFVTVAPATSTFGTYTVLFVDFANGGMTTSTKCTLTAAEPLASLPSRS